MPSYKKKPDFFDSEEGLAARGTLQSMVANPAYCTEASYSSNIVLYPDHLIPFVDKHMSYLRDHPTTNPQHYLANLKLMTRIGGSASRY